jgi:hypothetical protein
MTKLTAFRYKYGLLSLTKRIKVERALQQSALENAVKMEAAALKFRKMAADHTESLETLTKMAERLETLAAQRRDVVSQRRLLLSILETTKNTGELA